MHSSCLKKRTIEFHIQAHLQFHRCAGVLRCATTTSRPYLREFIRQNYYAAVLNIDSIESLQNWYCHRISSNQCAHCFIQYLSQTLRCFIGKALIQCLWTDVYTQAGSCPCQFLKTGIGIGEPTKHQCLSKATSAQFPLSLNKASGACGYVVVRTVCMALAIRGIILMGRLLSNY